MPERAFRAIKSGSGRVWLVHGPGGRSETKLKEHIVQPSHVMTGRGKMLRFLAAILMAAFAFVIWGCGNQQSQTASTTPSLYDQLGGKDGITQISETFLGNVAADDRINNFIAKADTAKLLANLTDFLGEQTGGPQVYTGPDPAAASQGLNITDEQWEAAVGDLKAALNTLKVPETAKDELLDVIEPIQSDVVGH